MDFSWSHREGGYGFSSVFPRFFFTETVRGCVILNKYKYQGKAVEEVTVNSKEGKNLFSLLSAIRPRIQPQDFWAVIIDCVSFMRPACTICQCTGCVQQVLTWTICQCTGWLLASLTGRRPPLRILRASVLRSLIMATTSLCVAASTNSPHT